MKFLKDKQTRHDFVTYAMCLVAFAIVFFMQSSHMIPRMIAGQLVPITAYIVMAISLNLVVGIAGDLSLGHAGFMSVGAYTGIVTAVGDGVDGFEDDDTPAGLAALRPLNAYGYSKLLFAGALAVSG